MDVKKIKQIEKIIGTTPDGVWGPDDKTAFKTVVGSGKQTAPPAQQQAPPPGVTPMQEAPEEMQTYQ
jgi:hypothetical protein